MSKYWEEVRNHYTLKANINMEEYELCDLYLIPQKDTKDYMCKCYAGYSISVRTRDSVLSSDYFPAYDLESAKAKAEAFVMQHINRKKDKLESDICRYNKILEELK